MFCPGMDYDMVNGAWLRGAMVDCGLLAEPCANRVQIEYEQT